MTVKIVPSSTGRYYVYNSEGSTPEEFVHTVNTHEEALALRASLLEDSKQDIDTYEGAIEYDQGAGVNV